MKLILRILQDFVEVAFALVILAVVVPIFAAAVAGFVVVGALVSSAILLCDEITWIWRKS